MADVPVSKVEERRKRRISRQTDNKEVEGVERNTGGGVGGLKLPLKMILKECVIFKLV
jgi:hypothetical protein